jgi:dihydrofolate reductase
LTPSRAATSSSNASTRAWKACICSASSACSSWPTSTDEPFASWINGAQKHVASTTLDSTDAWANSTLIKGELADHVADLRERDGGTIGTAGSPTLVRSLIDLGLLDELTLMISPVVAGGGRRRLFADDGPTRAFELVEAQPTSSGTIIATYRPASR